MKWKNKGHELDFVGTQFTYKKKIYIYGTREVAKNLYIRLEFLDCVVGFIDGNQERQKTGFMGKPVYSIDQVNEFDKNEFIIVVAAGAAGETSIAKTLLFNGYKESENYFLSGIFISFYLAIYAMYAHNKVVINLYPQSITEKCTLKCLHCNHSLPYLKDPIHFPKEEFMADLDLFFKHVDYVYKADFVGGEIFTHPDMYEMMKYTAEKYRDKMFTMSFITNGTVVPSDEIIDLMEQYDIWMVYTDYSENVPRIRANFERFIERAKKSKVTMIEVSVGTWRDYAMGRAEINFLNEQEKINHFDYCSNPCRYMREGKLYYCTSDRLAQRAGITPIDEYSYLDFREMTEERRMEILEFECGFNVRGYPLLCTKCNGSITVNQKEVPKGIQYSEKEVLTIEKFKEGNYGL